MTYLKRLFMLLVLLMMLMKAGAVVPVYAWTGWDEKTTAQDLLKQFKDWKKRGVVGVCVNCGFNLDRIREASHMAHKVGLEYHAWIPTMVQGGLDSTWYTVNRLGQSAYSHPAYVDYYKTLDPRNPQVQRYLVGKFTEVAQLPDVDYVQLDYIRYADVILARALWDKYGLIMNGEYPAADYCYCDSCVEAFKRQSGIDIRKVTDPSKIKEWAQFRCDNITRLVNMIAEAVHHQGKKVSADVFPGPDSYARWMVRQEWNKWNIDAYFPMNYNDFYEEPASWLRGIVAEEVKSVAGKNTPVYSGLFICHDWQNKKAVVDPENSGLLPSEIELAVRGSMESGAKGVCLFTPQSMTEEHWKALQSAIK